MLSPLTKAVARGSFKLWTIIGALHCEFSRSYPNKSGPWVAERFCRVTLISQSSQNVWTIEISGIRWMHSKWRPDLFAARAASGTGRHGAETCWLNLRFCVMPEWDLRRCEAAASLIYHWELPSTTSYVIPHLQQRANRKTATSIWTTQRVWPSWLFCHAHLTPLWHSNS